MKPGLFNHLALVLLLAVDPAANATGIIDYSAFKVRGRKTTAEYLALREGADPVLPYSSREFLRRGTRILFVPGFLSDAILRVQGLPGVTITRLGEYFDEHLKWLSAEGIEVERVKLGPDQPLKINSRLIAERIRASTKPVILIGHSKGGLDALQALVDNPGLWPKVQGFIAIQSPFWGSPVADHIEASQLLRWKARGILRALGGTETALANLKESERVPWMMSHLTAIHALESRVPVISVTTWKNREPGRIDSLLKYSRDEMLEDGIVNDGLVPWKSQVLPGSDYVALKHVDHAVTVMHCVFLDFDRIRFLETLLEMTTQRLRRGGHGR